jgi:hypothetical protein
MKVLQLLLLATLVGESRSLLLQPKPSPRSCETKLYGMFDFEPLHGGGSGKEELDEQWETQQAILAARRGQPATKQKYGKPKVERAKPKPTTAARRVTKSSAPPPEEKKTHQAKPKFFWEK